MTWITHIYTHLKVWVRVKHRVRLSWGGSLIDEVQLGVGQHQRWPPTTTMATPARILNAIYYTGTTVLAMFQWFSFQKWLHTYKPAADLLNELHEGWSVFSFLRFLNVFASDSFLQVLGLHGAESYAFVPIKHLDTSSNSYKFWASKHEHGWGSSLKLDVISPQKDIAQL